jgi:hypothetical protein
MHVVEGCPPDKRIREEAANRLREESAAAGGDTIASVERYEVGFFEVES